MLPALVAALAHVPTYGNGADGCFTPPHHHDTSQVIYVKGSGGLEIHLTSLTKPFDVLGGEIIDFDAVFKREYDQSTFDIYVGCGGCVASQDSIVEAPRVLSGYQRGEVEPFTQTAYHSVFPKSQRKYNTSLLAGCAEAHWTIRLVDYHNRSNGEELIWGAVIGLGESFTLTELLSFPNFVLNNHGETWNGMPWTAPISFLLLAPFLIWLVRATLKLCKIPIVELDVRMSFENGRVHLHCHFILRELFYELAIIAFAGTMIEMFIHLLYAQAGVPLDYGFWVGLLVVIGFANGLPLFQVVSAWAALLHEREGRAREAAGRDGPRRLLCGRGFLRCSASPAWAPVEILTGLLYFLLFGAGFWLGPTCIVLAGCLRVREMRGLKALFGVRAEEARLMGSVAQEHRGGFLPALFLPMQRVWW